MKNFRELENLSAYLDGQLDESESARLESRIKSDRELESALRDLRSARNILRQLPSRKAPRNFTLTRQMVGLKPPLPRSYPLLRFATVFATILFLFSFTANTLAPMIAPRLEPVESGPAFGMGGGCAEPCGEAAATEAAAEEPSIEMPPAAEAPTAAAESLTQQDMQVLATATPDMARMQPTPSLKEGEIQPTAESPAAGTTPQPEVPSEPSSPFSWTWLFLIVSVIGAITLWVIRQTAKRKWL